LKKILLLKAKSKTALLDLLHHTSFPSSHSLSHGEGNYRLAILSHHHEHFEKLKRKIAEDLVQEISFLHNESYAYSEYSLSENEIAFLFPGQGSQYLKMLDHLKEIGGFNENLQKAFDLLKVHHMDLSPLVDGSSEGIDRTQFAQPILACFNYACLQLMEQLNIKATYSTGHSFGELSALNHGGLLTLEELIEISIKRGELMAKANVQAPGLMLAVFEKDNKIWESLHEKMKALYPEAQEWLANINSPSQLVYSAKTEEIQSLKTVCENENIKHTLLSASAAFHSKLMAPVEKDFLTYLEDKINGNLSAKKKIIPNNPYGKYENAQDIPKTLAAQLTQKVDWINVIQKLEVKGVKLFIELGPKNILTKLTQDIASKAICLSIDSKKDIRVFLLPILALGVEVNLSFLDPKEERLLPETGENKIIKGFLEKQQKLLLEAGQLPLHEQAKAKKCIAEDTEIVLSSFFKIEGKNPIEKKEEDSDEATNIILTELSALTGFQKSEIKLDARFDSDLYLDSMTRLELLSNLAEKFKADISDMTALLNANTIRELKSIVSKYSISSSQVELTEEASWLKNQIINYTGLSEDKIKLTSRFNEDLMLDSLIKMELIAHLKTQFPQLQMSMDELTKINSLQDIQKTLSGKQSLIKTNSPKEKKFSRSIREELARFLSLKLDAIKSTTDFEHELNLNIFEKEDFINSLLIKHPYLQQASRELLHAKTLGDILEIEEIFDRRSPSRGNDEEISRFQFDLEEVLFKTESFRLKVSDAFIKLGPWGKDFSLNHLFDLKQPIPKNQSFSFQNAKELFEDNFFQENSTFSDFYLVLHFKSSKWEKRSLERFIQELYYLCISLKSLDSKSKNIHLILDSQQNPLLNSIPAALRSLTKEAKLSIKVLDLKLVKSNIKNIPWSYFNSFNSDPVQILFQQGKKFFKEKIKAIETPKLAPKISMPAHPHILLVGGARGITSEIAKFLADYRQAKVTALGRTPLSPERPYPNCQNDAELREEIKNEVSIYSQELSPNELNTLFNQKFSEINNQREIWNTKESIERRGGQFLYVKADATHKTDFEKAIKLIQSEVGPINGIIHSVGVTKDGTLPNKSFQDFHEVIYAKLASAINVYDHFSIDKKLSFVCFFSSLSSWSGAPGQVDYSYANEFLNQLAIKWNQKSSYPVSSLLWSVWHETGLAQDSLIQRMQELKLTGISNRAGIRLFKEEILQHGLNHSKVLFTPLSTLKYSTGGNL